MRRLVTGAAAAVLLALAGCGGDDDGGDEPAAPPPTTTTQTEARPPATTEPAPEEPAPQREERRERTPRSLADCIREEPGVAEVIVKGRESEDASFFAELVGGRVDVLGVTRDGDGAEQTVALFASGADATEAVRGAAGQGFEVKVRGSALVIAPPRADTAAIDRCLSATRYATG